MRILLAEPHALQQKLIARLFESLGCTVDAQGEVRALVPAHRATPADVVLIALLPHLDDARACSEQLREDQQATGKPLALFGLVDAPGQVGAGEGSPLSLPTLDGVLERPLKKEAAQALLARYAPASAPVTGVDAPSPHASPREAADEIGLPLDIYLEIFDDFSQSAPGRVVSLQTAYAHGNLVELARVAHALRGIALSLELLPLGEEAAAIEDEAKRQELTRISARIRHLQGLLEASGQWRLQVSTPA